MTGSEYLFKKKIMNFIANKNKNKNAKKYPQRSVTERKT